MAPVDAEDHITVQVCFSPRPRVVDSVKLRLPPGSTVADALRASGLLERHGLSAGSELRVGVWGRQQPLDSVLREADRVEVYRGLLVDPKEARRLRYRKQQPRKPLANRRSPA
jgi:uncharacterized protein